MPKPSPFELLLVKVERANQHIINFENAVNAFWASEPAPHVLLTKDNPQTQERTYYLRVLKEIPLEFSAFIGDILQNLRSALDHLAWHLVMSSPVLPKASPIYFPIFETAEKYKAGKMGKIQGMSDEAIKAIDAIEPYYTVDGTRIGQGTPLWWLHTLNNRDKHRLLIPVLVDLSAHTIPRSKRTEIETRLRDAFPDGVPRTLLIAATAPVQALEDGSELLTLPISEAYDAMQFRVQIGFREPAGVRGKEAISTLKNMHRIVRETVTIFRDKNLL